MTSVDARLVPAALTCWAVTAIAIVWRAGTAAAVVCVLVAASAAVAGWRARRQGAPVRAAVSAVVLGAAVIGAGFGWAAAVRVDAVERHPLAALYSRSTDVTVTASEQPRPVRDGGRVVFRAALRRIGGDGASGRVTVFAPARGFGELTPGRPASFRAVVGRPTRRDLSVAVLSASGTPTFGEASAVQRAAESVRRRFADAVRSQLPADQAAALPALVLGDTSTLPPETVAAFRAAGLTHLTAVSGANVTIVCGAVLLTARFVGPRVAVALAALVLVGFVIVVQPSASVLRAAVMGAIGLLGVLTHRRRHAMPALSTTVIALMIVAPEMSVDLGFALSVSATAALIVIAPMWSGRLVARGWPKPVADAICVATAAQVNVKVSTLIVCRYVKAAIYTRISADQTGERLGVTRQLEECLALADRMGWEVVDRFDDNDLSAFSGKTRPGFEAMLDGNEARRVLGRCCAGTPTGCTGR